MSLATELAESYINGNITYVRDMILSQPINDMYDLFTNILEELNEYDQLNFSKYMVRFLLENYTN